MLLVRYVSHLLLPFFLPHHQFIITVLIIISLPIIIQMLASQPLESFDVLGCRMITDRGITGMLSSPVIKSTLSRISLAYCTALTDASVKSILGLQKLEWVDLRDCVQISAAARTKLQKRLAHAQVGTS